MDRTAPTPASWRENDAVPARAFEPSDMISSSLHRRLIMIWLTGVFILLPLDFLRLPLNITPVDLWIAAALPFMWFSFLRGRYFVGISYSLPMWIILVASLLSAIGAPSHKNALVVLLKESYTFIWFITVAAAVVTLDFKDRQRILSVWNVAVLLHGLIILAQFASPAIYQMSIRLIGDKQLYDIYRPAGLFQNANTAAFFQVLGFVPLVLLSRRRWVAMIMGILLLGSMMATGSMGATLAFCAGIAVALVAVALNGHLATVLKFGARMAAYFILVAGVLGLIISQSERYQQHIEKILFGRAERSSEGRFDLWQRGIDYFLEEGTFILGVGPENFRVVDHQGKQLHNDILAFTVERGLLGLSGLMLFAALTLGRSGYMLLIADRYPGPNKLVVVVFLAAIVAVIVESLTHQTFHFREYWLVLAFQEAILFRMLTSDPIPQPAPRPVSHAMRRHRSALELGAGQRR